MRLRGTANKRFACFLCLGVIATGCTSPTPVGPARGAIDAGVPTEDSCETFVCERPNTICEMQEETPACVCIAGFTESDDGKCTFDPCAQNPCPTESGKSICSAAENGTYSCSCDPAYFDEDSNGDCIARLREAEPADLVGIDLSGESPSFDAAVVVVEPDGNPVFDAEVILLPPPGSSGPDADSENDDDDDEEATNWRTDFVGRAQVPGLLLGDSHWVRIEKSGFRSETRRIEFSNAGGPNQQRIVLFPLAPRQQLLAEAGGSVSQGPVRAHFPPYAFVANGDTALRGLMQIRLTSLSPLTDNARGETYGPLRGRLADGQLQLLHVLSAADVELSYFPSSDTTERRRASLAADLGASLALRLPPNITHPVGTELPLFAYDDERREWSQETTCEVRAVLHDSTFEAADTRLECVALVSHFSAWLVAEPAPSRCVYFEPTSLTLPAHLELRNWALALPNCTESDGVQYCDETATLGRSFAPASENGESPTGALGALCALTSVRVTSERYVLPTLKGTLYNRITEEEIPFYQSLTPVPLDTLLQNAAVSDVEDLGDEALCAQSGPCEPLAAEFVLDSSPVYRDEDGDGFWVSVDDNFPPFFNQDCDDLDPTAHPRAYESPCDGRITRCGNPPDPFSEPVPLEDFRAHESVLDWATQTELEVNSKAELWSAFCKNECAIPDAEEQTGNSFDDDCDGMVLDRDGDGFLAYSDQMIVNGAGTDSGAVLADDWDCDDESAAAHPGQLEVPGNGIDEDCDGIVLDMDGDGWVRKGADSFLAYALGEGQTLQWGDCNDNDAQISPDAPPTTESALAVFFEQETSGVLTRKPAFCQLLDENGDFNAYAWSLLQDRNCDGEVTDADGDGWTLRGHTGLGADRAYDCNDFDPRVVVEPEYIPVTPPPGGFQPGATIEGYPVECQTTAENTTTCGYTKMVCVTLPEALVNNEDDCAPRENAHQCEALSGTPTQCIQVQEDIGLCTPPGWQDQLPPRPFELGVRWGPCDFTGALPSCPRGTLCGTPIDVWTEEYTARLEQLVAEERGETIDLQAVPSAMRGMCFPVCDEDEP